MKMRVQNNSASEASRKKWFIPSIVTFGGTLVANEVKKISNEFGGQDGSLVGELPRAPSWLRHCHTAISWDELVKFVLN